MSSPSFFSLFHLAHAQRLRSPQIGVVRRAAGVRSFGGAVLHIRHIHIDEEGRFSIGSDHNRIKLTISLSVWHTNTKERRAPAVQYLPKAAYEAVAEDLELHLIRLKPTSYDKFVCQLREVMRTHELAGGRKRKPWWNTEVRDALVAR